MYKKISIFFFCFFIILHVFASKIDSLPNPLTIYRATVTKINNIKHTTLEASFDYQKSYLNGKVWLTLSPHFYPTDSLSLDAKGMNIYKVQIQKNNTLKNLSYTYDSLTLHITLDKKYTNQEKYTIYIEYTAKPNEFKTKGSAAINDAKGLYFINPLGKEKNKPTQIWTQGETQGTSVWVPTIDNPNQKTTQHFILHVPEKYVSLSNGQLIKQVKNNNGTRTDYWQMDLPNAPYLFFIGIGDYAVIKDYYKGKEVAYYVEKEYAPVARKIFGNTPEMMQFFSHKLGVEFPWNKYSQMTARDYVSGAMENTTATLHQESAQQDARELKDGNSWETTIAHELFHQWFGDLVTMESWSNLTVNESFADYSQLLWLEYKYGQDFAYQENYKSMQNYLSDPSSAKKNLVRFFYQDQEDMFDVVSYQKGGRILHMLRNYVGDEAFYKSLNLYLTTNKYSNGSAHKLRIAFETITGKDLNWFFNQWYFNSGHPILDIKYKYNEQTNIAKVFIEQKQKDNLFKLPIFIDIYCANTYKRVPVIISNKMDSFEFAVTQKPDLINVDAEKILLCSKKDNKTLKEYIFQFKNAKNYLDRKEALDVITKNLKDSNAKNMVKLALSDSFYAIKLQALKSFNPANIDNAILQKLPNILKAQNHALVKEAVIDILSEQKDSNYKKLFISLIHDSSYTVAGAALEALADLDSSAAYLIAKKMMTQKIKKRLAISVNDILIKQGRDDIADFIFEQYKNMPLSAEKISLTKSMVTLLNKIKDEATFNKGIDLIVEFRESIPIAYKDQTNPFFNDQILKLILNYKSKIGETNLSNYVESKLPKN